MAVSIFNSLVFGGINSADYGIYITGEAVFNAPKRAVSMVTVPGRNGALALDQGRWENIEVSYPAGCFGDDQSGFASKIADFRNAIVSQIGYQRITDTYNPNEYRMGVYASGLDVKPAGMNRAGEFDIVFDCKPQRWLVSGENEITVNDGGVVTNPTQYASSPLLAIEGYGNINIGGQTINVDNSPLGKITLLKNQTKTNEDPCVIESTYSTDPMNTGDPEVLTDTVIQIPFTAGSGSIYSAMSVTSPASGTFKFNATVTGLNTRYATVTLRPNVNIASTVGTAIAETSSTFTITYTVTQGSTSATGTATYIFKYKKTVSGTTETLTLSIEGGSLTMFRGSMSRGILTGDSSVSLLGHPTYIDCDLGECYKIDNDEYISLNGKIALGSDLPTLASGANEITFDNTVTELKVVPRWFKL